MAERINEQAERSLKGHQLLTLIAAGHSLRKSAEVLNLPYTTANRYYKAILAEQAAEHADLRENILQQELESLRQLMVPHMKKALNGDDKSARVVLSILERRAKLLGLDQAIKVKVEGQKVERALEVAARMMESSVTPPELKRVDTLPDDDEDDEGT